MRRVVCRDDPGLARWCRSVLTPIANVAVAAGLLAGCLVAWSPQLLAGAPLLDHTVPPQLEDLGTVSVDATAVTRRGIADPAPLLEIVTERLHEVGLAVTAGPANDRAVVVRVQCREEADPSPVGPEGSAAARAAPAGPPCTVTYLHHGRAMTWRRLNRVAFNYGVEAAKRLGADRRGLSPVQRFVRYLSILDFPVLLAAEWAQVDRLRRLLEDPRTDLPRKRRLLALLGEIQAREAVACLVQALDDEPLSREAALALGNFGLEVREPLVRLLRSSSAAPVRAAAAKSLGRIGARTGDWTLSGLFIDTLDRPDLALEVQVELVWALGYNPDRRALPVLDRLYERAWGTRADDPRLDELRKALDFSHRAIRLGGHADQY